MNPYQPPESPKQTPEDDEQLETDEVTLRAKAARVTGACIFACAFAIIGELVLQPYLNAYFGLPHPQALAALVSTLVGANLGYRVCEGLTST